MARVDREKAFDEGLLEQDREAKTLRVAHACTVREQGEPFVFRGTCLEEQVAEKLLSQTVDLLRCF